MVALEAEGPDAVMGVVDGLGPVVLESRVDGVLDLVVDRRARA